MLDERFVIVGFIIGFFGALGYLIATLKGQAKPNKVTWLIWAIAPLIAFFAEIKEGVGLQSLMTFGVGFNPLLIFFASFVNKKAYWKIGKLDIACGLLALVGLGLWQITGVGNIAILFGILADGLAAIPTVIKSWFYPETENYTVFLGGMFSSTITLLTIDTWNFEHWGFPVYILLITLLLFVLIKFNLGKKFINKY